MKYILLSLVALFLVSSCTRQPQNVILNGFAQGSTYHIVIAQDTTAGIMNSIDSLINRIDKSLSIYNSSSLLSKVNANQTDSLDEHLVCCLHRAQEISRLTDGMFDITVMPLVKAFGFGAEGATQSPNVDSLLQFVGYA